MAVFRTSLATTELKTLSVDEHSCSRWLVEDLLPAPEDALMWVSTPEAVLSKVVISRLGNYKKEDSIN